MALLFFFLIKEASIIKQSPLDLQIATSLESKIDQCAGAGYNTVSQVWLDSRSIEMLARIGPSSKPVRYPNVAKAGG